MHENAYETVALKHPDVSDAERTLVGRLATADSVVEVGIGNRSDVAAALADRGVDVTATDVTPRPVPDGVTFVEDDVTDPELAIYEGADLVFARNLPPELHRPARAVARRVDAGCWFTTLGGDQPAVPVEREQLDGRVTLFRVVDGPGGR
ncbi:UPF0146 family protein [Haloarcula nitratireducens]|uniref:UPF0146 protein EGH23_10215 n=1 Tax=Haloarcula nitratireducens TaxID=2487749 RepID=A0AAW4PBI6_9EURY|nr:UPF0146 family protein [Halomicroarcula nitratireducens]MBX0295254.1 hypothetical protein [Halomicroarcula nitratireducens]